MSASTSATPMLEAKRLAQLAVEKDQAGDLPGALASYKRAAEALHSMNLGDKYASYINQYLMRAEAIQLELAKSESGRKFGESVAAVDESSVALLESFGFHADAAREALSMFDNDVERATDYLFTQTPPPEAAPTPASPVPKPQPPPMPPRQTGTGHAEVDRLQGLLARASVDSRRTCVCELFTDGAGACGRPAASDSEFCWNCKLVETMSGAALSRPAPHRDNGDVVMGDPTAESNRLRNVLAAALVSETETCMQSIFSPDGTICGRPAALVKSEGEGEGGDGDFTVDDACWSCKVLRAMF